MSLFAISATEHSALSLKPIEVPAPSFQAEQYLLSRGAKSVCGVDEVGRGPLAGPVVTAAVILDPNNIPQGLNDSKKMTATAREKIADEVLATALAVSYAALPAAKIDELNIRQAALRAMKMAIDGLAIKPDYVLVDGRDIPPKLSSPAFPLIKGDSRSVSIAAASIIAKIMRDKMMVKAGEVYPAYGFANHAGYGTLKHKAALEKEGAISGLHRFSFAPLKNKDS